MDILLDENDISDDKNIKNQININTTESNLINGDNVNSKTIEVISSDIEKINKSNQISSLLYDNLDYLFSFLDLYKPDEVNVVLLGYCFQIFSHLLDFRGETLISYLFSSTNKVLIKLLSLIKYKSISDCICKVLTFSYDDNIIPMLDYKAVLLKSLLKLLEKTKDKEVYESICDLITNALSDIEIYSFLIKKESFIEQISNLGLIAISSDYHFRAILKMIIACNEIILSVFLKKVTKDFIPETQYNTQQILGFGLGIRFNAIAPMKHEKIINDLLSESNLLLIMKKMKQNGIIYLKKFSEMQQQIVLPENKVTYDMPQEVLGLTNIILIKYLRTVIDIFVNAFTNNLLTDEVEGLIGFFSEKQIFKKTIDYFFRFQFNNIYQTLFLEIMSIVTNEYSPKELINAYFRKSNLLNIIVSFFENDALFAYK